MSKLKNAAGAAAAFAGRHKKAVILLALLAIAAAAAAFLLSRRPSLPAAAQTGSYVRTVTLSRGTLEDSISATGTVESAQVSTVTTELTYAIASVQVQVGDRVQEGDVICTLDTSDLEKNIQKLTENATDAKAEAQKQYEQAQQKLTEAEEAVTDAWDVRAEKESAPNSAKSAYDAASSQVSGYQSAYDEANAALLTAMNALQSAQAAEQAAAGELETAKAAWTALGGTFDAEGKPVDPTETGEDTAALEAARAAVNAALEKSRAAQAELKTAQDGQTSAQNALKTAQENLQAAQSATGYTALSSAYTQAQSAFEQADTAYENAVTTSENAEGTRDTALENYNKAGESDELEELQSQLEKCTLRAEAAGTVTALNATVGSRPEGAVATIQDTDQLQISITIAEYDIEDVAEGMRAVITSDALEGEIEGTLTQISPTASGGGASSSSFAATVTVDTANSGLRIGTNAAVEIIQSTTEDVFTVPLDAIETREDGTSVIYVRSGESEDAEFEPVEVVVGQTNDYYAEISGVDLAEGMVVRAAADEAEATETTGGSDMFSGGMFSMGGGDMPGMGGGGMPAMGGGPGMGG